MTRKDYKIIAEGINRAYKANVDLENAVAFLKDSVVPELIILLHGDNYRFDTEKFKEACFRA